MRNSGAFQSMNRRTFLKIAGLGSISITAACSSQPDKTLYSLVHAPDDMVTGQATWYASTCRECPAGCGVLAKNREGRIVKIEGNPLHKTFTWGGEQMDLVRARAAEFLGAEMEDRGPDPVRGSEC